MDVPQSVTDWDRIDETTTIGGCYEAVATFGTKEIGSEGWLLFIVVDTGGFKRCISIKFSLDTGEARNGPNTIQMTNDSGSSRFRTLTNSRAASTSL